MPIVRRSRTPRPPNALLDHDKRRTNLFKCCLIIIVACLLFIVAASIVFLLLVQWRTPRTTSNDNRQFCATNGCDAEAEFIRLGLDETVDPCQDFFQFSCGNFAKNVPRLAASYPFYDWDMVVSRKFGRQIVESLNNSTNSGAQYAKIVHNLCLEYHREAVTSRNDKLRATLLRYKTAGSPTVFAFNLKRDFMLESFLSVRVTSASEFPGGPPALVHITSKLPTDYDSARIDKDWAHLVDYDPEIANLSTQEQDSQKQEFHELWKKLTNLHLGRKALPMADTVFFSSFSKLQTYPNQSLSLAIEALSQGIISRDTMIRFQYDVIYIDALLSRYPVTAKQIITTQLLRHLITSVPDQDTIDASVFSSKFPLTPEDACLTFLTTSSLSLVLGTSLLDSGIHLPIEQRMNIRHLLSEMKESLKESIFSHFVDSDRPAMIGVLEAIDSVRTVIGYPVWLESKDAENKINDFYKQFDFTAVNDSTFLDVSRRLGQFFWRKQFASHILHETNPPPPHFSTNAHFNRQRGIELQWGLLQPPLYRADMPLPSLYGAVGFVLSHELLHLLSYYKRIFDATNERTFLNQSACFESFYDQFCFDFDIDGTLTKTVCASGSNDSEENIADAEGLALAYRTFQRKSTEDVRLEKLSEYSSKQLFFMSFAARFCSSYTPEHLMRQLQDEIDPHAPDVVRVNGAVSNSEQFAQAFRCPEGRKMNQIERCSLFAQA